MEINDTTYFLSVPPERYRTESSILKKQGSLMTQITPEWLSRNPLTILNLLIISQWWATFTRKTSPHFIDHYLGKDIVNNILAPALQYSTGTSLEQEVQRRFRSLQQRPSVVRSFSIRNRPGVVRDMLESHASDSELMP